VGPINIGNPAEFSIRQLAELVGEMVGRPIQLVFKDLPVNDPMQRRPDITAASELLNWTPNIPLVDGLMRTISYFRDLMLESA